MQKIKPLDLSFGAVFVCLMAIGANITVWFPILSVPIGGATVPLSLQTFFAILAGYILGHKLGSFAMIVYTFIGLAGVPVFAGLSAGPMALISPTGGFIISFIFVAYIVGKIVSSNDNVSIPNYTLAAFIGLIINYVIGVTYMYIAMNVWLNLPISYPVTWMGMIPFFIKDSMLSILAVLFFISFAKRVPATWIYR